MVTHTITRSYKDQSPNVIIQVEQVTDAIERNLDVAVPAGTEPEYDLALLKAKLKSVTISSDQAITVNTNANHLGTPQDVIPLVAGQVIIWSLATDQIGKCPFSNDVTKFFFYNQGAAVANVKIRSVNTN